MSQFMDLDNLSVHEKDLLKKAIPFAKKFAEENAGFLPGQEDIRQELHCGQTSSKRILDAIADNKLVPFLSRQPKGNASTAAKKAPKDESVIDGDNWKVSLPSTRIHTLEQLLEFFHVDTEVWEVKRFVVNKWEMGYIAEKTTTKNPACASPYAAGKEWTDYRADVEPLYQVKAELIKKQGTVEHYAKENARLIARNAKLQQEVGAERKLARTLAANHAGYDDLLDNIKNFVDILGDFQLPVEYSKPARPLFQPAVGASHTEDAVMLLSDTHFGDVIRREDTSGFPEFDLVISANRFGYVMGKAKQVLSLHRAMYPIKKLYVWVGGDIGNGILHDSGNSNALFMPAQVHFSYHMLKFGIEDLVSLTVPDPETGVRVIEEIVLLFTVGNHMRVDEKMPHKYQAQRTLDWLIYQFIIERFSSTPRVTIRQEMSPFIFENIRGHRHMFAHGMQVGFRNSPDAQNKAIGQFLMLATRLFDSPEWRKKNGLEGETFSRACIGDIHIPISYPRFKSNGSLNGQNELGVNWTLEPIPAGQQIWGVADKHQETWQYFLECTHIQREQEDFNKYGIFSAEYAKRIGRC